MRFVILVAFIAPLSVAGCDEASCSFPDDARDRADQLVQGCFDGRTYCAGSGVSRISELESVQVENWAQIQSCGTKLNFKRIETGIQSISVVYFCNVDDLAIEYQVSFSEIDPPCESVSYQVYRYDEYMAYQAD